jgi:hypothetical protein
VIADRLGDPYHLAIAVMRQCWATDDYRDSRAFADEAIPLLRRCGNLHGIVEIAASLVGGALRDGDYEAAAEVAETGLLAAEECREPFALTIALGNAALPALMSGRMELAEQRFRRQIETLRRAGIEGWWFEPTLGLACIAADAGENARAATLLGAFDALPGLTVSAGDREFEAHLRATFISPARAALGEREWERVTAAGAAMTRDELCQFALAGRNAAGAAAG